MSVVTMGGRYGTGGRVLGAAVAERLEADYVDRLILANAARQAGATVEALHERESRPPTRGERLTSMLQRILERSAITSSGGDPYFGPGAMALLTLEFEDLPEPTITRGHELEDEKYFEAIRSVITDLAAAGNVVIVGRGGSLILRDYPRVLRVGTVAHMEDRITRTMELQRIDHDEAEKILVDRDAARADYYKRYFGVDDADDPNRYHLVINTSEVDVGYAETIVVGAAEALDKGDLRPEVGLGAQ